MKKASNFFLLLVLLVCTQIINAQVTLEYSNDTLAFGESFYCTDIGDNEFKYVLVNASTNSFGLFNLDMSPFMTNISLPTDDSVKNGFVVAYVTRTLFDCDSTNIEYAYEAPYQGRHPFRLLRTNGTALLYVDSARAPYCFGCLGGSLDVRPIRTTPDGTKLFLDKLNLSGTGILIYSLCGTLPTGYYKVEESKSFLKLFPNPTSGEINFDIKLPGNTEEFQLQIIDGIGNEIKRESISRQQSRISLDVSSFSSGNYFYALVSKTKVYQTGKFILSR